MKICKCCDTRFKKVPDYARPWIDDGSLLGWFWECNCKTTLFVRTRKDCKMLSMKSWLGAFIIANGVLCAVLIALVARDLMR